MAIANVSSCEQELDADLWKKRSLLWKCNEHKFVCVLLSPRKSQSLQEFFARYWNWKNSTSHQRVDRNKSIFGEAGAVKALSKLLYSLEVSFEHTYVTR
jgi:hypothetical protein